MTGTPARVHHITNTVFWQIHMETSVGMDVAHRIKSEGYVFQVEMTSLAHRLGYRIVETPITFPQRRSGESKMSWKIQAEAAWRVFS